MRCDVKCKNCKCWKKFEQYFEVNNKEGTCTKLAYSDKLSFLIENGEDIHQFITDEDFFCYHFDPNND